MTKFFYRANEGDTVFSLSKKFSIPPVKIIKINMLKKEIQAGDLLYLQTENVSTKKYTVQPFDTLESVSKKLAVDKQKIISLNGVEYLFYGLIIEI